ncbi:response regulator [Nonomuraea sp. 10N515B]|uniref:response regulator n=1 Tax=Nonomuraea sp. 10N515B TaxID=3457422 RepID=UPI003FCC4E1F
MSAATVMRVIVVDDQQIIREGLVALLGLLDDVEVVGAAGDGEGALRLLEETSADIVLMDLRMPVMDGVEATERITRQHPQVAVLVLTTYADDESIIAALRAGARGYLTKDAGRSEIAAALRATASGQSAFDAAISQRLVAAMLRPDPVNAAPVRWSNPDGLTPREAEVLRLIAQGMSNQQIAASLFIGESTVKTHINNAFSKIGARSRSDAMRYAFRHGLVQEA